MKLYSKDGILVTDSDVNYIRSQDIFYLDLIGQEFNFAQILDQYIKVCQVGLSGTVFKLNKIGTKDYNVLKIIPFNDFHGDIDKFIDEMFDKIYPLKMLEHRNIIKINNLIKTRDEAWIITEYAGDRNLSDYLQNTWGKGLREIEARFLILQLLQCISYCHQKGIVHGNLSNKNILLSESYDHFQFSDEFASDNDDSIDEDEKPEPKNEHLNDFYGITLKITNFQCQNCEYSGIFSPTNDTQQF